MSEHWPRYLALPRCRGLFTAVLAASTLCVGTSHAQVAAQAVVGKPFGVGQLTFELDGAAGLDGAANSVGDAFVLTEGDSRVLYPAVAASGLRRALRQIVVTRPAKPVTVYFLFTGNEPLNLTLHTASSEQQTIEIAQDERLHGKLLQRWWREYRNHARQLRNVGDHPSVVEDYLTTMLARRLQLKLPPAQQRSIERSQVNEGLGLLLGTDPVHAILQPPRLRNLAPNRETAVLDLPSFEPPPVAGIPEADPEVPVEPIAMHVPEECAYVRFGSFSNFLWLRDFIDQWGGDLQNMIAIRGLDDRMNQRLEQQLALRQSALAKILGPAVIADVAILFGDSMIHDGAAIGILFQARNNLLLSTDFGRQRKEAVKSGTDVTDRTVKIAGHDVSFLSTPDNRVRSFYAADGDFHLVTTSRAMVERFFEAGTGAGALGSSPGFQHARKTRSLHQADLVFVYLSDAFFRQMLSPGHSIERLRRRHASRAIGTLQLARWAARAEQRSGESVDELISMGFLPEGFGRQVDGSYVTDQSHVAEEGARLVDSLRGARGTFLPIADVAVTKITATENEAYARLARRYQDEWGQMPSVVAGIRRQKLNDQGLERIVASVRMTPFHADQYGWFFRSLGPPTTRQIAPIEGDMASLQAVIMTGLPLLGGEKRPHHVFGGLRDFTMPIVVRSGRVDPPTRRPEFIRGYLGAWPKIGLLRLFVRPSEVVPDEEGYAPLPGELGWQRSLDPITVFSFKRDVLAEVTPQIRVEDAEWPAQVRLRVADLTGSQLSLAVNAFGYQRARRTSVGGAQFMNALSQQLHVPLSDCQTVGEALLNARFVCPLGGQYTQAATDGGPATWTSTAIVPRNRAALTEVPDDYRFPLLEWFRGLDAELCIAGRTLKARAEIDIQQKGAELKSPPKAPQAPGFSLPSIPGFGK